MSELTKEKKTCLVEMVSKPWVAIEAIGQRGSVSLAYKLENLFVDSLTISEELSYSSSILPLLKKLLSKNSFTPLDIQGLILVNGPGSFTGLRVTNGLVHGLSEGLNCPVFCTTAFEIYAFAWCCQNENFCNENEFFIETLIDARLNEYYHACVLCEKSTIHTNGEENLSVIENLKGYGIKFSFCKLPSIINTPLISNKNSKKNSVILKCPTINTFVAPKFSKIKCLFSDSVYSLSSWAILLFLHNKEFEIKKTADIQPLYIRDNVALSIKERSERNSLILETFKFDDLAVIASIEKDSYKFGWSEKNFRDSLTNKYVCKKLINNSLLVGYYIWMIVEDECHILNFTIAKERQNKGLGQYMLSRLIATLKEHPLNSIFLEVRPSNKSAIKLYGKNGFEIVGRRKNYYPDYDGREDALVMRRILINRKVNLV